MKQKTTKAPDPVKNVGGRPRTVFDLQEVEKVAALGCTYEEAAAFFSVSLCLIKTRATDDAEWRQAWDRGAAKTNMSLRRAQLTLALDGNATMQIWLGKQRLGQKEPMRPENEKPAVEQKAAIPSWLTQHWHEIGLTSRSQVNSDSTASETVSIRDTPDQSVPASRAH